MQSYTIADVAVLLDRTAPTVRIWVKKGLPVLPDTSPRLICGQELKCWLTALWDGKKRPCAIDEMFCVKCRHPRRPDASTVQTAHLSSKTTTISGKCGICGTGMQQSRSLSKLPETIAAMTSPTRQDMDLSGYTAAPLEQTLWTHQGDLLDNAPNGGKHNVH